MAFACSDDIGFKICVIGFGTSVSTPRNANAFRSGTTGAIGPNESSFPICLFAWAGGGAGWSLEISRNLNISSSKHRLFFLACFATRDVSTNFTRVRCAWSIIGSAIIFQSTRPLLFLLDLLDGQLMVTRQRLLDSELIATSYEAKVLIS